MNNLEYKYDPYFMNEVIEYGENIGADTVVMLNGEIYLYYKRGDMNSKYYPWVFDPHITHRRLQWNIANNASVDTVVKFLKNMGKKAELINIHKFVKPDLPVKAAQ